jgi:hypothetical protein
VIPLGLVALSAVAGVVGTIADIEWMKGACAYALGAAGGSAVYLWIKRGLNGNISRSRAPGAEVERRTLRLMADYQCFPLWERGGHPYNVDPADLPLTAALRVDLAEWAGRFDQSLNEPDPASSGFATDELEKAWILDGHVLASRLQEELDPAAFVVLYTPLGDRAE